MNGFLGYSQNCNAGFSPGNTGPGCNQQIERYWYNTFVTPPVCSRFLWTGCGSEGPNFNNFDDFTACTCQCVANPTDVTCISKAFYHEKHIM